VAWYGDLVWLSGDGMFVFWVYDCCFLLLGVAVDVASLSAHREAEDCIDRTSTYLERRWHHRSRHMHRAAIPSIGRRKW